MSGVHRLVYGFNPHTRPLPMCDRLLYSYAAKAENSKTGLARSLT
ncbi:MULTISPECIES: hypothetical protein [unclassified Microcoleus]